MPEQANPPQVAFRIEPDILRHVDERAMKNRRSRAMELNALLEYALASINTPAGQLSAPDAT